MAPDRQRVISHLEAVDRLLGPYPETALQLSSLTRLKDELTRDEASPGEVLALREDVGTLLMRYGFKADGEPNTLGLVLESVIDELFQIVLILRGESARN